MYEKMGAHLVTQNGVAGAIFSVWAPNARSLSVVGSFNGWDPKSHQLSPRGSSGIWEGFIPGVTKGALYKFHIESRNQGFHVDKADPLGLLHEKPPRTASVVWDLDYKWGDRDWMQKRGAAQFAARAAIDLRSTSGLVDARAGRAKPFAHLSRDCARDSPNTWSKWGSPTSSSCR